MTSITVLDSVLERFATTGPEYGPGLSNHGPMASEALVVLGRPEAAEAWAEEYASRLREHPESRNPIDSAHWREALGDSGRVGDWIAFFEREVREQPWPALLELWVARLVPGIMAAATHGIIRTAHATRSLDSIETPERLHEFAEGLAYWAARYQELPSRAGSPQDLTISDSLRHVPRIDDSQRGRFLIYDAVRVLDEESFGPAINLVSIETEIGSFVTDLTRVFVRQYLANANTGAVAFVHSVTAPSALRMLAPHLSTRTARLTMRYAWQACAALYATYGRSDVGTLALSEELAPFDAEDLIDQAVAARDEHAIKFTEACLREYRLVPDPAFIAAAKDAVARIRR